MRAWEYLLIDSQDVPSGGLFRGRDRSELEKHLNSLGREGWEIVNLDFRELEGRLEFTGVAKRELRA